MDEKSRRFLEYTLFAAAFLLVLFGLYLTRSNINFFENFYTAEDGFIEWLSVLSLLIGAVICFRRLRFYPKRSNQWITTLTLAILFVFGAGEEVSWGQRLIGLTSPDFFAQNNAQGEMNVHNLIVAGVRINKLIFSSLLALMIFVYLVILPLLYRKIPKAKELINKWAIPIAQNRHIVAYVALAVLVSLMNSERRFEILEFGGSMIFVLICLNPLNPPPPIGVKSPSRLRQSS